MKVVFAPDSFKESLSAQEVARIMVQAFLDTDPSTTCISLPMADGGEGTLEALTQATGGEIHTCEIRGPLGDKAIGTWGLLGEGRTAVIEMAKAAGLEMVPLAQRNPLLTSSWGVGELILQAIEHGCEECLVTLGGSATVDGGVGMLQALGAKIFDHEGKPVEPGGGGLSQITRVETHALEPIRARCRFTGLCDVENPLLGPQGAAAVFAPQKGADAAMVQTLEAGLAHWAQFADPPLSHSPRGGAAGGLGFALEAFLGAPLRSGVTVIAETLGLPQALEGAQLLLTGEGGINGQSVDGKVPCGVARMAQALGIPVIAVAGTLGEDYEKVFSAGIDAAFSLSPGPVPLEDCLQHAHKYLYQTCLQIAKTLRIGRTL